jgi:hypothetical protein
VGDTLENRIDTLEASFPSSLNDPYHDDPDWQAFLKHGGGHPLFRNKLFRLLSDQMRPKEALQGYLAGLGITDLLPGATPLTETKTPVVVNLADVEPRDVEWLWWPYLAQGMVGMLDGDPGIGKSLLTTQLGASCVDCRKRRPA